MSAISKCTVPYRKSFIGCMLSRQSNWIAVVWITEMARDFRIMQNQNFTYCFIQVWILVFLPIEQSTELSIWTWGEGKEHRNGGEEEI